MQRTSDSYTKHSATPPGDELSTGPTPESDARRWPNRPPRLSIRDSCVSLPPAVRGATGSARSRSATERSQVAVEPLLSNHDEEGTDAFRKPPSLVLIGVCRARGRDPVGPACRFRRSAYACRLVLRRSRSSRPDRGCWDWGDKVPAALTAVPEELAGDELGGRWATGRRSPLALRHGVTTSHESSSRR